MSILAGGYLPPDEALDYIRGLENLCGVAVGGSSVEHVRQTFNELRAP